VARLGYADLHPLGLERRRAEALVRCARAVSRLTPLTDAPFAEAEPLLRGVPGVGPWTAAGLSATTWGEPDTVLVGDDGIPSLVAWLLAREPVADDARMLELLEPYRPHRYRVVRLAFLAGIRPPRRAPRGRRTDVRRW
jgi:3-methyladenine DNA glycosylase/8-oxoguanine DNA glycosylase